MQRILKLFVSMCIIRKQRNEEHEHREEQRNNNTILGKKLPKKQGENNSYPKVILVTHMFLLKMYKDTSVVIFYNICPFWL